MSKLIDWITQNPPAVIALTAAFISAAVALFVAIISQWALSRRARRELLTKKLEELYLVLNDAASDCVNRYKEIHKCFHEPEYMVTDEFYKQQIYNLDVQKKLVMYVKLYFPRLGQTYASIFVAQSRLNDLVNKLMSDAPPKMEELDEAFSQYGKCLGVMEDEIVSNKPLLTGSSRLFNRYRTQSNNGMHPTADTTDFM
jgi:hypothetical protein